ncbi:E3 ubiquitin-protein ligase RING1-like [Abeliophyllum distichum]|uniref:RING-type E3 ubiquitin transferase n=1 Tax=Abeliophyllum distichum TaxID=126358 RepID=A0ABD1V6U4_9LAMI
MSSAEVPSGGGGNGSGAQQYYCHQCERFVTITPLPSPPADLVCPNCNGGFLEESDTVPPSNPTNPNDNPNQFFPENFPSAAFGGLPIIFSSATGTPRGAAFSVRGGGLNDLSSLFGGSQSPDEFNPFAFLNQYVNNLQARGANIQLVFEGPGGGGASRGVDFGLPSNLGDYFVGPGLEQLIQQLAENDPNRYGTPPASKSAVDGLPDIKVTEELLASDSSQCAVCKDSFELKEEVKQIPCKHIYHKDCILPWLELHNSCPVCRYELPTDDPDYENRRTGQVNDNSRNSNNNMSLGMGLDGGEGLVPQRRRATVEVELAVTKEETAATMIIVGHQMQALEEELRLERRTWTEGKARGMSFHPKNMHQFGKDLYVDYMQS